MANVVNHCRHGAGAPNHDCDLQNPKNGPGVDAAGNSINKPFVPPDPNKPHGADKDQDPGNGPGVTPPKPPVGPGV